MNDTVGVDVGKVSFETTVDDEVNSDDGVTFASGVVDEAVTGKLIGAGTVGWASDVVLSGNENPPILS